MTPRRYIPILFMALSLMAIAMNRPVLIPAPTIDQFFSVNNDTLPSDTITRKPHKAQQTGAGSEGSPATLETPEPPATEGFAPTIMSDIKAADPTSGITVITPPTANQRGSASLQYPLQMPPARNGMQPQFTISYNSDGGNGWLGEGWDLSLPVIAVDTRWGVPRYDTQYETETYLLNGQMLCTPDANGNMTVAHRGPQLQRAERLFYTRQAGDFAKIERKGTSPSDYSWIVTDNHGTKHYYGRTDTSRLNGIVANGGNAIAEWHLDSIVEIHGDYIAFKYAKGIETVLGNVSSQAIYLHEVRAGNAGENAHTIVTFTNQNTQKNIRHSSARYGFLTSSNKLLSQIEVKFSETKKNHSLFRRYDLSYSTGEFGVQLLDSIKMYGPDGMNVISKQGFDYYDDTNDCTLLFLSDSTIISNSEIEDVGILSSFLPSTGDVSGKATMIGATKTKTVGASFYGGIGPNDEKPGKNNTVGMSIGYSKSTAEGISSLIDINGDGLPDKVYKRDGHLYFQPQVVSAGQYAFGDEHPIQGRSVFSKSKSSSFSGGIKGHIGMGDTTLVAGGDYAHFKSETTDYFSDVNADGLTDIVSGDKVYFNHLENGIPTFTLYSSDTPSYIDGGGTVDTTLVEVDQAEIDTLLYYSPMMDAVQVWRAPKAGIIKLTNSVSLVSPSEDEDIEGTPDGVRVAIQKGGSELAYRTLTSSEPHWSPSDMTINVRKGDKIYYRVQCGNQEKSNGSADKVNWIKGITYTDYDDSGYMDHPNGYNPGQYNPIHLMSAKNIVMVDRQPFTVTGDFTKPVTSDDVRVRIYTFNGSTPTNKTLIKDSLFVWNGTHTGNLTFTVNTQNVDSCIYLELYSTSDVAWQSIRWNPSVVMLNNNNEDTIPTSPRYHTYDEVYKDGHTLVPGASGTINIKPMISFNYGTHGTVYVTIKNMSGLKKKIQMNVSNGTITNNNYQSLTVNAHEKLWADIYGDDEIISRIQGNPYIEAQHLPQYNFNDVGIYGFSEANDTLGFGHLFRGWGQFAYNAGNRRYAAPIEEDLLGMTTFTGDNYNILEEAFVPMSPDLTRRDRWVGPNEKVWVSCNTDTISAARLISNDIAVSNPLASYEGNAAHEDGTAIGFPIISKGYSWDAMAGEMEPGLNNSSATANIATGKTHTLLSTMDLNGDGYPDLVSNKKIAFTNSQGVLSGQTIATRQQEVSNSSTNYSLGGNPVFSHTTSRKKSEGTTIISQEHAKNSRDSVGIGAGVNHNNDEVTGDYIDINGDGLPDMIYKNGNYFYFRLNLGYRFDTERPLNINGFGIQKSEARSITPSGGFNLPFSIDKMASSFSAGIGVSATDNQEVLSLTDINSDGLPDMLYRNNNSIKVALSNGMGVLSNHTWNGLSRIAKNVAVTGSANAAVSVLIPLVPPVPTLKLTLTAGANTGHSINRQLEGLRDIDGDGFLDIISSESENNLKIRYSAIRRTNKLRSVKNSLGGTFTLDYVHSTPTYGLPGGKWVLSEVVVDDGIHDDGPNMTTRFEYSNGRRDRHEREFLGFGEVIIKEIDTNPDTLYRQTVQTFDVSSYYTQGNLLSTCVKDAQGRKYSEVNNTYYAYNMKRSGSSNVFGTGTSNNPATSLAGDHGSVYTPIKYTESRQYEGGASGTIMSQHFYTYYITSGSYGALEYHYYSDKGTMNANPGESYDYYEYYTYKNDVPQNVLNLPTSHYVYAGGSVVHHDSITYGAGRNTSKPLAVIKYYSPTQFAQTYFTYDTCGNVSSMTLPANHKGQRLSYTYEYEDTMNMYISSISDSYGYHSQVNRYAYQYGIPLESEDLNGMKKRTYIDSFGRVIRHVAPKEQTTVEGTSPGYDEQPNVYTLKLEYAPLAQLNSSGSISQPAYAITQHYDILHPDNPIEIITFVDGFGRPIQIKKDATVAQSISNKVDTLINSGKSIYDAFGRIKETYYPTIATAGRLAYNSFHDNTAPTSMLYDILDRQTRTTLPNGTYSTMAFTVENTSGQNTEKTMFTDALGHQSATYVNGSGLIVKSSQFHNNEEISTLYIYDGIQRPKHIINCDGDTISYTYDMLDRTTQVSHPASGTISITYDPAGNMLTRQTANLADTDLYIRYFYTYSRLDSISYPQHPENNVVYLYGGQNAENGRRCRLWGYKDATGAVEYSYGDMGEIVEECRSVVTPYSSTTHYRTKYDYDSFNRLLKMTYPDNEKLFYNYDAGGQLFSVTGSFNSNNGIDNPEYTYVADIGYDKDGLRKYVRYGNNTISTYTYDVLKRMLTLQLDLSVNNNISNIMTSSYAYDATSNITNISQQEKMSHNYTYDDLNRLIAANGQYANSSNTYTMQMAYDNMYRITSKTQTVSQNGLMFDGNLFAGYSLGYDYKSNEAGKHFQLSTITENDYRTTDQSKITASTLQHRHGFEYDANGNVVYEATARKHKNNVFEDKTSEVKYRWDEDNRLLGVDENGFVSHYFYDANGERALKVLFGNEGRYINSMPDTISFSTEMSAVTLYISPYFVANNNHEFTKHIYMGGERIVSKICDPQNYGSRPTNETPAFNTLFTSYYTAKRDSIESCIESNYRYFGVPYAGGYDMEPEEVLRIGGGDIGDFPQSVEETQRYFYNKDHLGSSTYITDKDGNIVQHLEYLPYGEVFIDKSFKDDYATPYKFNGKELDEETGLYYYGARYLHPKYAMWLSTDPLEGTYPNVSSYTYCHDNPILRIDKNGNADYYSNINGKYLGSDNNPKTQGDMRLIADLTFSQIQYNNPNDYLQFESNSIIITFENDKIQSDLQSIRDASYIDKLEHQVYLYLDRTTGIVSSHIGKNGSNSESIIESYPAPSQGLNFLYTDERPRNKILIGQVHTHPTSISEGLTTLSQMSDKDKNVAILLQIPIYGIDAMKGSGEIGFPAIINRVNPNGNMYRKVGKTIGKNNKSVFNIGKDALEIWGRSNNPIFE